MFRSGLNPTELIKLPKGRSNSERLLVAVKVLYEGKIQNLIRGMI